MFNISFCSFFPILQLHLLFLYQVYLEICQPTVAPLENTGFPRGVQNINFHFIIIFLISKPNIYLFFHSPFLIIIASPKEKKRYLSSTATSYACNIFSLVENADTNISKVDSGKWKFVIKESTTLNWYPG